MTSFCTFSGWGTLVDIAPCRWNLGTQSSTKNDQLIILRTKHGPITIRVKSQSLKSIATSLPLGGDVWADGIVQQLPNRKTRRLSTVLTAHSLQWCKGKPPKAITFDISGIVTDRSIDTNRRGENFMRRVVATNHGEIVCYFHRHKRSGWLIKVGQQVHLTGSVHTSRWIRATTPRLMQFFHVEQVH